MDTIKLQKSSLNIFTRVGGENQQICQERRRQDSTSKIRHVDQTSLAYSNTT